MFKAILGSRAAPKVTGVVLAALFVSLGVGWLNAKANPNPCERYAFADAICPVGTSNVYTGTLGVQDSTAFTYTIGVNGTPIASYTMDLPLVTANDVLNSKTENKVRSSGAAFDLEFLMTEAISADRTLTFTVNNANRAVSLAGDLTTAAAFTTSGANPITFASNATSSTFTLPVGAATEVIVGRTSTDTLTNKTLTTPTLTTPTIATSLLGGGSTFSNLGQTLIGTASAQTFTVSGNFQVQGTTAATAATGLGRWTADASGPLVDCLKSRGAAVGTYTVVQNNDTLCSMLFYGADGTDAARAATIEIEVDASPGANDMPARIVFSTSADGTQSPTARFVITNGGLVEVGTVAAPVYIFSPSSSADTVFNATGADINWRVATDADANALVLDAGVFSGVGAWAFGDAISANAYINISPAFSFGTAGGQALFVDPNITFAAASAVSYFAQTIRGNYTNNAVANPAIVGALNIVGTATNTGGGSAATVATALYIESAMSGGTANYAVWVDAGQVQIDNCIVVGAATGGCKGNGTINVSAGIYLNDTAYTNPDYVFDHWVDGRVLNTLRPGAQVKANAACEDQKDTRGREVASCARVTEQVVSSLAASYTGLMPLDALKAYIQTNRQLPRVGQQKALGERLDILLEKQEEGVLYLIQQKERIDALEARLAALEERK